MKKTLVFLLGFIFCVCAADARKKHKKGDEAETPKKSSYELLVGRDSVSMDGVMNVIKKEDSLFLELPIDLLGREFLVVNRLKQVPAELNESGVNRGINYENQVIRFEWDKENKSVIIRQQRPTPQVENEDRIAESVYENYIDPVLAIIKTRCTSPDSTTVVFSVEKMFNGQESCLNDVFNQLNIQNSPTSNLCRILDAKTHKDNVNITSELTTVVHEGTDKVNVTVVVNSTLLLLSEKPMQGREENAHVGYFSNKRLYYSDHQQTVETKHYINRWRLEPSDPDAYMRGEKVKPTKPIVFCLDKRIPSAIRPYIKKGIEDWNAAFENAGFLDAIQVVEMTDSMEQEDNDLAYSTITYAASEKANAMGPSLVDPRSGEILEADVIWWHNVKKLLSQWIVTQTGAVNPEARRPKLSDELLGDAARFVATHEVGHSLGLRHNMRASSAYPTDSLRSVTFTNKVGGTSASIMDYARFNYVAQPEDGVKVLSPHIGPYDMMAIEWGYRWFPDEERAKKELSDFLHRHNTPEYRYSETLGYRQALDPRAMSEDLGDDPLKSARYGLKNLKRIVPNIQEWTTTGEPGQTWDEAARLWNAVINQWDLFNYHVLACVGGIYLENTEVGDGEQTFTYVEKDRQKEAVQYLIDEVFTTPDWLFRTPLEKKTYLLKNENEEHPMTALKNEQNYIFWDLLANERLIRMLQNEYEQGKNAFTATEMIDMLYNQLIVNIANPDVMERSMQKSLVDALITASAENEGIKINKNIQDEFCTLTSSPRKIMYTNTQIGRTSDAISLKRALLMRIRQWARNHEGNSSTAVQMHYADIAQRIETALGIN